MNEKKNKKIKYLNLPSETYEEFKEKCKIAEFKAHIKHATWPLRYKEKKKNENIQH